LHDAALTLTTDEPNEDAAPSTEQIDLSWLDAVERSTSPNPRASTVVKPQEAIAKLLATL
jgi:hypothetical protein